MPPFRGIGQPRSKKKSGETLCNRGRFIDFFLEGDSICRVEDTAMNFVRSLSKIEHLLVIDDSMPKGIGAQYFSIWQFRF